MEQPNPGSDPVPPIPPASTPPPTPPPANPAPEVPPPPQASVPPPQPPPAGPPPMPGEAAVLGTPTQDERLWAMITHLSGLVASALLTTLIPGNIIAPLIIWLIKREGSAFINDQGKEAMNFQITITLALVICGALSLTVILACVTVPAMMGIGIYAIIVTIIAAVKSYEGVAFRYPATIRFIT